MAGQRPTVAVIPAPLAVVVAPEGVQAAAVGVGGYGEAEKKKQADEHLSCGHSPGYSGPGGGVNGKDPSASYMRRRRPLYFAPASK